MGRINKIANPKLLNGPAKLTNAMPLLGLLKLLKFTGTGLADPNINRPPVAIQTKTGTKIEPIGSMCGIGLRVILPCSLAVSSPSFSAISPWLISWIMAEKIKMTKVISKLIDFNFQFLILQFPVKTQCFNVTLKIHCKLKIENYKLFLLLIVANHAKITKYLNS